MIAWLDRARRARWVNLVVVNLRILVAFAFVPAGLKKVLREPFTDPDNHGPFHDFLHAFHATGVFYQFVGVVQLTAALLLMSQRWARAGALLALPVITAIAVFCWSTAVYPTATVATLIWLGVAALLVWDLRPAPLLADLRAWQVCGLVVLALYVAACAIAGGVYRPRGAEDRGGPAFYLLSVMPLVPLVTLWFDCRRWRGRRPR